MGKMISYCGEEINFNGCPGCAYAKHEFELPCGMVYENENFTISQDWELPIQGFMIVSPRRCVDKFSDLSQDEKNEMFSLVDKTIKILRQENICDRFDVIFEEKENRHLHVWIMPRYKWMEDLVGNIIGNIGTVFTYAKENFRNEETYIRIKKISNTLKNNF